MVGGAHPTFYVLSFQVVNNLFGLARMTKRHLAEVSTWGTVQPALLGGRRLEAGAFRKEVRFRLPIQQLMVLIDYIGLDITKKRDLGQNRWDGCHKIGNR
jgi:hypothetical protein